MQFKNYNFKAIEKKYYFGNVIFLKLQKFSFVYINHEENLNNQYKYT